MNLRKRMSILENKLGEQREVLPEISKEELALMDRMTTQEFLDYLDEKHPPSEEELKEQEYLKSLSYEELLEYWKKSFEKYL
jgi:hypothetical protein